MLSWFIDKMVNQVVLLSNDNKEITDIKNKYNPIELGRSIGFCAYNRFHLFATVQK
jgi:hypothetical protein